MFIWPDIAISISLDSYTQILLCFHSLFTVVYFNYKSQTIKVNISDLLIMHFFTETQITTSNTCSVQKCQITHNKNVDHSNL